MKVEEKKTGRKLAIRGTVRSLAVVALAGVVLPVAAQFIEDGREDRLSGGVKVVSPDARPVGPRTAAEILKEKRPPAAPFEIPPEGVFVGSGCYDHSAKLKMSGFCFTYWEPEGPHLAEEVDLALKEGVGNTMQWWASGAGLVSFAQKAAAKGLYSTCLGATATKEEIAELRKLGVKWLGYDFGERYSFNFFHEIADPNPDLQTIADEYMRRVHNHVTDMHRLGWGNVMATSSNFSLDYEVAAGVEIPCTEDFPFGCLTLSSALARGLYRQYGLPTWGTHIAHEWNCYLPHTSPYRMRELETSLRLKYMTGAKIIINESGNWAAQSNLCPDSPMSTMPILPGDPPALWDAADPRAGCTPEIVAEAKRRFANIDYRSPTAMKYRRALADFWAFCREHPAPKGQPEAAIALAKGNLDLAGAVFVPNYVVAGALPLAAKDLRWYYGAPEKSWQVVRDELLPQPPMFGANRNIHLAATPYGQVDIASFAADNITADFLLRNYRTLIFSGWNTCSMRQYRVLCDYVKGGGRLVISLPHLSTNRARNFTDFTPGDLVNGGDFSELCGLKVTKKGLAVYWATGPSPVRNAAGFVARRRFGILACALGELEYTQPKADYEMIAVDDERMRPVIVRCRRGKGEVFFVNTWAYPAMVNEDCGPGLEPGGRGMMSRLYAYVAKLSRGHTWITGPDFENPDEDCRWIVQSYFPDAGRICFLNLDYEHERKCVLHWFGEKDFVTLKPGEFRLMDAPVLTAGEKLNER